ncbi:hypothetical protein OESDEN_00626 [Oesophagostomum dentatum]|uniref:Peptidase C1A papain C-terminal domain-containing protein n=1 Tax=Oesophagostomum dentatum TaxID=61180 RepID=A0A0B1TP97_OESDE|nr:hypothetical protein OESDEN_00626 [Oesophagostomum dentatum]
MCQLDYLVKYENDKIFAKSAYRVSANEKAIQKEIMINGPVQASFTVYADFRAYKKRIYKLHLGSICLSLYAFLIKPWKQNLPLSGYFRMIRGTNDCDLEKWVDAGIMKV